MKEQQTLVTSKKWTLQTRDFLKGILMAVGVPVVTTILVSIQAGNFVIDLKAIVSTAAGALIFYLSKNFATPAQIVITNPTEKEIAKVETGDAVARITTIQQ